jgi:hypothetical protein
MTKAIDGKPVIDAKSSITLHIAKQDCVGANPKRPESCAAARNIKRDLKAIDCRVHLSRVYIRQNKGNWQRYATPANLRAEIIAFDRGGAFEPGDYILSPLQPTQRKRNRSTKPIRKRVPQRGNRTANVRTGAAR